MNSRLLIVIASVTSALAQTSSSGVITSTKPAIVGGVFGSSGGFMAGPLNGVTGKPFSAQEVTERLQTLADGTHITSGAQKVMHYRDSLGRTRTERTPMQPPSLPAVASSELPVFIEIFDPVGGYRYSFDSKGHTAYRSPLGPRAIAKNLQLPAARPVITPNPQAVAARRSAGASMPRPEVSTEQLGTQTIEGVLAEGVRVTTTFPVGLVGNDRPLAMVTETWTSPEIGMAVLRKTSDPRSGETTMKLTNISHAEPDASLFQPPAGYEIVDPANQAAGR